MAFLFLSGFLLIVFLLVWFWDWQSVRDKEKAKKKEIDRLLDFDEADCYN